MLNEVVNDGSSASGGSRSGLSRRLEHLSVTDPSDAASAILSESLLGPMNGNEDDWEAKLREKLAPETKTKHRSKKVSGGSVCFDTSLDTSLEGLYRASGATRGGNGQRGDVFRARREASWKEQAHKADKTATVFST